MMGEEPAPVRTSTFKFNYFAAPNHLRQRAAEMYDSAADHRRRAQELDGQAYEMERLADEMEENSLTAGGLEESSW